MMFTLGLFVGIIVGVLIGLGIAILIVAVEHYLAPAERPLLRILGKVPSRKGAIIEPTTPEEREIKKNDELGVDTYLDDL